MIESIFRKFYPASNLPFTGLSSETNPKYKTSSDTWPNIQNLPLTNQRSFFSIPAIRSFILPALRKLIMASYDSTPKSITCRILKQHFTNCNSAVLTSIKLYGYIPNLFERNSFSSIAWVLWRMNSCWWIHLIGNYAKLFLSEYFCPH